MASLTERFWSKVEQRSPSECWEWQASRNAHGYGQMSRGRGLSPYKAHRLSWEIANARSLSSAEHVLHACDNPPCVNPQHLHIGDPTINARERGERGRTRTGHLYGSANPMAKLSVSRVREIRNLLAQHQTKASIAVRFGVSRRLILNIEQGRIWRGVY